MASVGNYFTNKANHHKLIVKEITLSKKSIILDKINYFGITKYFVNQI